MSVLWAEGGALGISERKVGPAELRLSQGDTVSTAFTTKATVCPPQQTQQKIKNKIKTQINDRFTRQLRLDQERRSPGQFSLVALALNQYSAFEPFRCQRNVCTPLTHF